MAADFDPVRVLEHADLATIADDEVIDLFRAHGAVLVRGAPFDPVACDAFAKRFTASHFLGYGRSPFPQVPTITTVNETQNALAPHTDNGIRHEDQRPDLTWFLCERPAATSGETTFFDGVRVWNALPLHVQQRLLEQRVGFHMRVAWRAMRLPDRAAFEQFVASLNGTIGATHPDESVDVDIHIAAVRRTRWTDELAYTSSLGLAGSSSFESLRVSLDGEVDATGRPTFPGDIRRAIDEALAACREELRWRAGDIVMLDNTRFLHGRNGFSDPGRRMYLIQTLRASF